MKTTAAILCFSTSLLALDYPHQTDEPQKSGWPLTAEERAYVVDKPEHDRRPCRESKKHLLQLWPQVPTAGHFGGASWLRLHEAHVKTARANRGPIGVLLMQAMKDVLDTVLIGDSITQGWGGGWDGAPFNAAWQKQFGDKKAVNLGIGGDRIESILWRLDHGALDGPSPKVIVLRVGMNNAPLVFANGVPAASAAHGVKLCSENLRIRCPKSQIVLVKVFPAFDPSKEVGAKIREINAALDALKLDRCPQIHVLDLCSNFTNANGRLKTELYSDKHLHHGPSGYEVFAVMLKPVLEKLLKQSKLDEIPAPNSHRPPSATAGRIARHRLPVTRHPSA